MLDRAWDDKWALNASYTLSSAKGNAEGPVNSDFNFADTGRTEAFDDPWVNYNGDGYLPNDRRHQVKLRGAYALTEHWQFGATLARRVRASDQRARRRQSVRRQSLPQLLHLRAELHGAGRQRVYELRGRGSEGRTPWMFDLGASVTYLHSFAAPDLQVKFAVYNLFNQERVRRGRTSSLERHHRAIRMRHGGLGAAISRRATRP